MRHDIRRSAAGITLRPVRLEDSKNILAMRSNAEQSRFVHPISPNLTDQEAWLEEYFERADDYYFVVERSADNRFEGTIALYDKTDAEAEFGRWFLIPGSLAAPVSALLLYQIAFDVLGLTEVYCRTVIKNKAVLSFHESSGAHRSRVIEGAFTLSAGTVDAVEYRVTKTDWPTVSVTLAQQASRAARLIARSVPQ